MVEKQVLRVASGWLELGMPDDALEELGTLRGEAGERRKVLELKLAAQMTKELWDEASQTACQLCGKAVDEPGYFLNAAFCLHEAGDTEEARKWLLRGPKSLHEMAVFHYNMACYLWVLGERERANNHLAKAIEMDDSFLETAKADKDFAGMEF